MTTILYLLLGLVTFAALAWLAVAVDRWEEN